MSMSLSVDFENFGFVYDCVQIRQTVLSLFGPMWGNWKKHITCTSSIHCDQATPSPFITEIELKKLANLLAGKDEEHASMQTSAESNDCGICTVENVHACLEISHEYGSS
ncbi:hypothetical protein B9Z55_021509 [Caenorhabditis nigoni]|uniref:Uncharacterized protein n=1 Tax=Caenorhabditis nigoni TaxID=1611254 RepID=A0A2G5TSC3_9PELO|nr:hypothetical protein B9Z55_021509 [Caenorhabditis nigoni]